MHRARLFARSASWGLVSPMGLHFTPQEGRALYGLLAETAEDIVLKTDRRGFIVHANPAIEQLGFALPQMLFGPHLADLARPDHADRLRGALDAALAGDPAARRIEFAASMADRREAWFEIRLRPLGEPGAHPYGALGIMRSTDERRALEEELFTAAMTDPLTGLTNRQAFLAMLGCLAGREIAGSLALFSIDHFKAVNMRYGQSTGDTLLAAFADFLRAALRKGDAISRIGNQRFAAILPNTGADRAASVCRRALDTLSDLASEAGVDEVPVSASVGLAAITGTVDASLAHAELALFLARAKGRNRLEIYDPDTLVRAA